MDRCVLEGKSEQAAGASPPAHIKKRENWTSLPGSTHFLNAAALQHTLIRGVCSFGLREWTITKTSRPFFSIEQSR